jgi:hypothetical protein
MSQTGNFGFNYGTMLGWFPASGPRALQIGGFGGLTGESVTNTQINLTQNLYNTGSDWKYSSSAPGLVINLFAGGFYLYTTPTGTANATATVTNRFSMLNTGEVGVNVAPIANISFAVKAIAGNLDAAQFENNSTSGGYAIRSTVAAISGSYYHLIFYDGATSHGSIVSNGMVTSYNTTSDVRLKDDLGLATSTDILEKTVIHTYRWKGRRGRYTGVFAQEAIDVHKGAVTKGQHEEDPWMVDYSKYVPDLIVGWQRHDARISALEHAIAKKGS